MKRRKPSLAGPACIYCDSVKPRKGREHVIPQGLGMFEQNWTILDVCDECNGRLGRELDLNLTRDSFEAYLRLETHLRPPIAAANLRNRRIKATLHASGPLDGSRIVIGTTPTGDTLIPIPTPQVGFRRAGEDWTFLTEGELSEEAIVKAAKGSQVEVRVFAERGGLERIRTRLSELGFSFEILEQQLDIGMPPERIQVTFDFSVDTTILRAVAKIAFNYATKLLGGTVTRRKNFDEIRKFIAEGIGDWKTLVSVNQGSPLVGCDVPGSLAHTCGIGWLPDQQSLIGVVCLFNQITYRVRLLTGNESEWSVVGRQHLFDAFSRRIVEINIADESAGNPALVPVVVGTTQLIAR